MKSLAMFRAVGVSLVGAVRSCSAPPPSWRRPAPVVSARPGPAHRRGSCRRPDKDGIHLTLDQAIGIALANNQDLNVTVNAAEASQYLLFSN